MSQPIQNQHTLHQLESFVQAAVKALQLNDNTLALQHLDKALQLDTKHAQANYLKGVISFQKGDIQSASKAMKKALKREPGNPNIHNGLGSILQSLNQLQQAQKHFKKATELNPAFAGAFNNLGVVYKQQGRLFEAVKYYRKAVSIDPDYGDAFNNLGLLQQDLRNLESAIISFRRAIDSKQCQSKAHSNLLLALNYQSQISPQEVFEEHKLWGSLHPQKNTRLIENRGKKPLLRIGYVSPDFRSHSVAYFFEPLLAAHNHEKYQIYCYYNESAEDKVTKRIRNLAHQWRNIYSMSDQEAIEQIIADDIDILVDLSGHTGKNRLDIFAQRAAPVQTAWLGYPNTSGLEAMDFRFTDEQADPKQSSDNCYTEQLIRLPHGFLCYQGNPKASKPKQIPSIENKFITFGSFNNLTKATDLVIQTWLEILTAVPDSKLILKASHLHSQDFQEQIFTLADQANICRKRIKMYGNISSELEHLSLYDKIDIALDPFPYNGTTTTCEAFWMGVPVLTLNGQTHASRVGASLLKKVNLETFIAQNKQHYIELAIQFANDQKQLQSIRDNLRQTMINSDLCNSTLFAHHIELAYEKMWNN